MEPQDSEVSGLGLPLVQCEDPYLAPVHVSAGGTHYTTTLSTLTRCEESKLAKLFNGSLPIALDPVNHHYFMDINGSVFAQVLDYLRYGELILPLNFDQIPLLLKQAEQLEIWPLVDAVNMMLKDKTEEENSDLSDSDNNVSAKKNIRRRRHRNKSKKEFKMREEVDNLVTRLGEVFHGFMEEVEVNIEEKDHEQKRQEKDEMINNKAMNLGDNMDTMIRANEDKNQKEDELNKLMKTLGDILQALADDIVNKMDTMIEAIEDNRQKEDECMDKLMKILGDNFQRMLTDSDRQSERLFTMLEQRQINQTVAKQAKEVDVIIVSVEYQYMKNIKGGDGYKIYFINGHGKAKLTLPEGVKASGKNSYIWTYQDISYRTLYTAMITKQLMEHGFQLITACELKPSDSITFCEYIFVRS